MHLYIGLGVMKKLSEYYANFIQDDNIFEEFSIPAEHSMVLYTNFNPVSLIQHIFIYIRLPVAMVTRVIFSVVLISIIVTIQLLTTCYSKYMEILFRHITTHQPQLLRMYVSCATYA